MGSGTRWLQNQTVPYITWLEARPAFKRAFEAQWAVFLAASIRYRNSTRGRSAVRAERTSCRKERTTQARRSAGDAQARTANSELSESYTNWSLFNDSPPPSARSIRRNEPHAHTAFAQIATARLDVRIDLAKYFDDDGTAGVFAAYAAGDNRIVTSDGARSRLALLPASTFKIANSIIALETGVVTDPDKDVFKWDGTVRNFPDWNRDHTLRSAIAASAVPVYQEIARRIGAERMKTYVDKLDYGSRDISGAPIDYFWLSGNLRISPLQQIEFLDRLRRGALPVSDRSQALTRDVLPVAKVGDAVIRSKSGLIAVDDKSPAGGGRATVGWLVGWAEKASTVTVLL
jgi:beta-lactamase class D